MNQSFYLSKTDFLNYLVCPAFAWINKNQKDLVPPHEDEEMLQRIFDQGDAVESLARGLWPGGVTVRAFGKGAADFTKTLTDEGKPAIYQATAFSPEGYMARADILVKDGSGPGAGASSKDGWAIYEVKSSTKVKEKHLLDLTFQKLAFERAGIPITKTAIVHLNRSFVKNGEYDPGKLFTTADCAKEVEKYGPKVEKLAAKAREYMGSPIAPTTCTCNRKAAIWERCPMVHHFHPHMLDKSIFHVSGLGKKVFEELVDREIFEVADIPDGVTLTDRVHHYRLALKEGKPIVKNGEIAKLLNGLTFPLYFLDYETTTGALPLFDGCRPYQNMPFQYSLHILEKPGGELIHKEFLATNETANPVRELAARLKEDIGETGSVIVWYKNFEMGCNEQMGRMEPEFAEFFAAVNERVFDLMEVFSDFHYLHPEFGGSASIKKVLPVLVPELSYDNLAVQKGDKASALWEDSLKDSFDPAEREQLYKDLLEYCKLDTLAMVKIYEYLRELTQPKAAA